MVDVGTLCLMGIGLIFYLALPIWGGLRASRSGHPGWAAVSILSIFIGLGPIGGILALTSCVEPTVRVSPRTFLIDGIDYYIERVLPRNSLGSLGRGIYLIVLFTAENVTDDKRVVATENWKMQREEDVYAPEWSLSTAAEQTFPGRRYHSSLEPHVVKKMIAAFDVGRDVYSDFLKSDIGLSILIPNVKDGVDERIEVKI